MDDAFLENPAGTMWFNSANQDQIFFLTKYPTNITKSIIDNYEFADLDLIPVIL